MLSNPAANGECGALSDPNFGTNNVTQLLSQTAFDPNLQNGWNKRGYNWEFSTGVQQQLTRQGLVVVQGREDRIHPLAIQAAESVVSLQVGALTNSVTCAPATKSA